MPGISGSTLAPKQARFNVARYGASRYGDYYPTLIVSINGTDRTAKLRIETLTISDTLNDTPGEASFAMRDGAQPLVGQAVIITLGTTADTGRLFAGTITNVEQRQAQAGQELTYVVKAQDYRWLLDRRLVSAIYTDCPAESIAADIISTFTTGGFTTAYVQPGLARVTQIGWTYVRPSQALQELANLVGATWYLDAFKGLHFFTDESGRYPNPASLTDSTLTFWDFLARTELAHVRTRAIDDAPATSTKIALTAGQSITTLPIADRTLLTSTGGTALVGSLLLPYADTNGVGNPTTLTADAAVGATSVSVGDTTSWVFTTGWADIGGNTVSYTGTTATTITGIPASGFGSILSGVQAGVAVNNLGYMDFNGTAAIPIAIPSGTPVMDQVIVNDAAAQTALGTLETGDGIHEMRVDGTFPSVAAATARATAELTSPLNTSVTSVSYQTRHPAHSRGRSVTVTLTGVTNVSGAFTIRSVAIGGFTELSPRAGHAVRKFPIRAVQAAPIQLSGVLDQLTRGEQGA